MINLIARIWIRIMKSSLNGDKTMIVLNYASRWSAASVAQDMTPIRSRHSVDTAEYFV